MANDLPSQEELNELFDYDPTSGKLFWKARSVDRFITSGAPSKSCAQWNGRYAGQEALTTTTSDGYLSGHLLSRSVLAHRVIWKKIHGSDPTFIDHIDGIRSNNQIANLRDVTRSENMCNQKLNRRNKTGVVGVSFHKAMGRYQAHIKLSGSQHHIGTFDTIEEAAAARLVASSQYGFHSNHGRSA